MNHQNVTTALELPNGKIVKNLGLVKGIIVRSRSIVGSIGGSLQTLLGGNISLFTELCENTREDAYNLMIKHAEELGANAIISVINRLDTVLISVRLANHVTVIIVFIARGEL